MTYKGAASTGFYTDYNHLCGPRDPRAAHPRDPAHALTPTAPTTANRIQNFLLSNYESQEGIDNDVSFNANHPAHRKPTPQKNKPEPKPYHPPKP